MLALLCCGFSMMTMMMTMMSDAASVDVIRLHSGEAVQLSSNLTWAGLMHGGDVRWTNQKLWVSLKNNVTTCYHGRCKLLADGSLWFSRVQSEDSGRYRLQVFDRHGTRVQEMNFELQVVPADSSSIMVSILCCSFLLLFIIIIIIFVLMRRRRRSQRTATGLMHDNVYMVMHSSHGNKCKEECQDADTRQAGTVDEDIYV